MTKHARLFEFLIKLIDIQIKKYAALTKIGIGPDAGMNAKLVLDQVEELFQFAEKLLQELEQSSLNIKLVDETFFSIFKQIQFYLDMEYLRGYSGWLIDENNIHSPELNRLNQQREQLTELAVFAKISLTKPFPLQTIIQRQCLHDSHAIAFLILDLAIKLKQNPELEFDQGIPKHAQGILRKHVEGPLSRYYQDEFWLPIQEIHEKCREFLAHSTLNKSTDVLTKEVAVAKTLEHKKLVQNQLQRFAKVQPNSMLFATEQQWHEIGNRKNSTLLVKQPVSNYPRMFGVASVAMAICAMIYYLTNPSNNTHTPGLSW